MTNNLNNHGLDNPIQTISEDTLNREPFVKLLSERISTFDLTSESVSVAIVAPWGNGKTSFLNMLIEYTEQTFPNTYKVIRFCPWRYTKDVNKTKLFFEILIHQTDEQNVSLSKLLKKYSSLLTEFEIPLKNKIHELFEADKDMGTLFQMVNDELKKSKYKYLIVIDDIDRLEGEEILEIIKIIRESANFSNLIFVVAFDKDYVNDSLKNLSPAINERYIEKFFPVEYWLPSYDGAIIVEYIMERTPFLTDDDSKILREYLTPSRHGIGGKLDTPLNDGITNLRSAIRWINSIKSSYSYLKGECVVSDLADCELLKIQAPAVYNALRRDWDIYTEMPQACYGLKLWNKEEASKRKKDHWEILVNNYKRDIFREDFFVSLDDITKVRVRNILKRLLPEYGSRHEKGFNNSIYIDRYFYQILQDSEISDEEFEKLMSLNTQEIKTAIGSSYSLKTMSLKLHLSKYIPSNKTEIDKLIRVYFYCGVKFEHFLLDPYTLYSNVKAAVEDLSEIKEIIDVAINENPPSVFFDKFFYCNSSQSPSKTWDRILSEEVVTQHKLVQLERAIEANYDLYTVISFFNALIEDKYTRDSNGNNIENRVYNQDAIPLLKDYWQKNLSVSFKGLIYKDHPRDEQQPYYLNNLAYVLWGDNLDGLTEELEKLHTDQSLEVIRFIGEYQANGQKPMAYKFVYLDIE